MFSFCKSDIVSELFTFVNKQVNNSVNFVNHIQFVYGLRRLSKDFKTLESHIATTCEVEFCSVGLLQKAIRRRFEESLL